MRLSYRLYRPNTVGGAKILILLVMTPAVDPEKTLDGENVVLSRCLGTSSTQKYLSGVSKPSVPSAVFFFSWIEWDRTGSDKFGILVLDRSA